MIAKNYANVIRNKRVFAVASAWLREPAKGHLQPMMLVAVKQTLGF